MRYKIKYRWVVAVALFVAYSVQYLDRIKTNVLTPVMAVDLGLSTTDIGTGAFLMLLFYGPAQYVSGILTDRFGAKKILIFSVIAWSLMTAWMGLIQTREEYLFRMALFGALVGTEYVPSARILMRWFSRDGRARAQALLSWAWILTPAWGSIFATQLAVQSGDWRLVFFVTAAFGVLPLFLIVAFVFDRPEQYRKITPEELAYSYKDEIESGILTGRESGDLKGKILARRNFSFLDLFSSRSYIAVVFVDVAMQITFYGALVWIPLYLSDRFGFSLQTMGYWSALYFVAGATGSFASSYLSDKLFRGDRRIMVLASFIGLAPFIVLLSTVDAGSPLLLAAALCGMGFFANMAWGPFLSIPAEIFTPEVYGKAMGFVNGVAYTVAAFSSKIFASLVVVSGGVKDYSGGWLFVACCVLVGIVAAWFIQTGAAPDAGARK
ncbi:MAG: MFS transporter [Burkholderiales bacterium]|nr:MFS transporter [Burkholderiales bacterium]